MSDYADQVWQWVYEPLRQLKADYRSQPDSPWDERLPQFLAQLGIDSPERDPIVDRLDRHVRDTFSAEADRARFVTGEEIDTLIYQWSDELAAEPADYVEEPAPDEWTAPAPPREPADVADEVAVTLALPIVRELASGSPAPIDGMSPADLIEALARLLAEELVTRVGGNG